MNCEQLSALVHELCDGALDAGKRVEAESHLSTCARCREAVGRVRKLETLLSRAGGVPQRSEEAWDAQRARILAAASVGESRTVRLSAAIVIGLGLLATGVLVGSKLSAPATGERVETGRTPDGEADRSSRAAPAETAPLGAHEPSPAKPAEPAKRAEADKEPAMPAQPAPTAAIGPTEAPLKGSDPPSADPVAVRLVGDPDHLLVETDEAVAAALADSPAERVTALGAAASARLKELSAALAEGDQEGSEDLAEAYAVLVNEGIVAVLGDRENDDPSALEAWGIANARASADDFLLARLEASAQGTVKERIHEARLACRRVTGQ
ncbi:hypothetical protein HY251_11025 [bacterium]|nr:hypothetical protein [bacterium]